MDGREAVVQNINSYITGAHKPPKVARSGLTPVSIVVFMLCRIACMDSHDSTHFRLNRIMATMSM